MTISGPPAFMRQLVDSWTEGVSDSKPVPVHVHAPYHAPHIYSDDDVLDVLESAGVTFEQTTRATCFISSSSGEMIQSATFFQLLERAVRDMLLLPLDVVQTWQAVASVVRNPPARSCSLLPVGSALPSSFAQSLGEEDGVHCQVDNSIMTAVEEAAPSRRTPTQSSGRQQDSKIAIVGMSGRFPDAADLQSFWRLLYQGLDVHRQIPEDRFNASLHCDPSGRRKNTSKVMHGCWIKDPGLFDPKFFNISPKEAEQSDPGQRLALQTAYEAIEMAGIVPDRTPSTRRERVGVFYGMTSDDWREVNSGQNVDTYFIPGGNRAFTPGRLNYFFKFTGPSLSIDTACSSSLAAIHTACNSLWRNDCDTAIAGGTNVMTNPDNFAGLDRGHFLSRTGNCNAFDDQADGYCRADGVGTVILKRLEDAEMDRDPILGVIAGAYTNHSAESVSITRPHAGAQEYIFSKLMNESGLHPHDVSYVEMHGTGTQAGDATEMASVLGAFAPDTKRLPHQKLYLGSAKANVGHSESASGVVSLIKLLLMMQQNTIPPHCGIKGKINHKFPTDLEQRNVHIARVPKEWRRSDSSGGLRRAFVDNFSAAGGNTALLVEDAPSISPRATTQVDERLSHVVAVSAKSPTSLRRNLESLRQYIMGGVHDKSFLSKLSYTTTARRIHHTFRLCFVAENETSLMQHLDKALSNSNSAYTRIRSAPPPIGFVFSGQGAQYAGMGRHFYHYFSAFRSDIVSYNSLVEKHGFPSILPLIDGTAEVEGLSPIVIQLGTVCLQMALATLWESLGVKSRFVIGHSLGEYAALKVARVLSASDAIFLAGTRAKLLEDRCTANSHAMLALRASASQVKPFVKEGQHEMACLNAPAEIVLSGKAEHIEELSQTLAGHGIKGTRLKVPFAFHSSQVDPILRDLEEAASTVQFHPPTITVGSALLARIVQPGEGAVFGPEYIVRHCREPVQFANALQAATEAGVCPAEMAWIELGPHVVCSSLLRSTLGPETSVLPTLRRDDDAAKVLAGTVSSLHNAGLALDWDEYHGGFDSCQEVLDLPSYGWDNANYWIQYVHDWTLTKGDPPHSSVLEDQTSPDLSTNSVQRILQDTIQANIVTMVAQSDFGSEQLGEIAHGHRVNNTNLCTSSLYADVALTLGQRLLKKYHPELTDYRTDVRNMNVDKSLILNAAGPTLFRAQVTHDVTTLAATMTLYSVDTQGKTTQHHAQCELRFEEAKEWMRDWERNQHHIERSIEWLRKRADQGFDTQLSTGMIYKVFSSLVDYSDAFKGMQLAILHSQDLEATAKVKFQTGKGNFFCHPIWIDSCGQLTGFLMNGHETTGRDQVYINHGWKSLRMAEDFREDGTYQTYIRMRNVEGNKYSGDLYIMDADRIIGVYGGITFLGISRRVLNMALPSSGSSDGSSNPRLRGPSSAMLERGPRASSTPMAAAPAAPTMVARQDVASPGAFIRPATSQIQPVLRILSEEIGVTPDSLGDTFAFADYGVDSLLSLTVTGRMREDLGIDMDSSVLLSCSTVGEFIAALGMADSGDESSSSGSTTRGGETLSDITTPGDGPSTPQDSDGSKAERVVKEVSNVLAEEIGVSQSTIERCTDWTELGFDSLLSLTVLGRLREELGLDFEAEYFVTNSSFQSLKRDIQGRMSPAPQHRMVPEVRSQEIEPLSNFRATSTLLQGSPKTAKHILFLFPDGSGSATSYGGINPIGSEVCVYGLNCPWLKTAEKLVTYGLEGLCTLYVAEMKRRQPQGPYNMGGWSAGGICAYEAAIQLTRSGDTIERLIFLDTPNPIGLEKLPRRLFDFFNSCGVFGDDGKRQAPEWLLSHFLNFIEALDRYRAVPWRDLFGVAAAPRAYILWAEDGVCKHPDDERPEYRDDDPREMRWLLENRVEFGSNGWGLLLEEDGIVIERIGEANHFTMMKRGANAARVAEFLKNAFI